MKGRILLGVNGKSELSNPKKNSRRADFLRAPVDAHRRQLNERETRLRGSGPADAGPLPGRSSGFLLSWRLWADAELCGTSRPISPFSYVGRGFRPGYLSRIHL